MVYMKLFTLVRDDEIGSTRTISVKCVSTDRKLVQEKYDHVFDDKSHYSRKFCLREIEITEGELIVLPSNIEIGCWTTLA